MGVPGTPRAVQHVHEGSPEAREGPTAGTAAALEGVGGVEVVPDPVHPQRSEDPWLVRGDVGARD